VQTGPLKILLPTLGSAGDDRMVKNLKRIEKAWMDLAD
jgi:hypothetical protein